MEHFTKLREKAKFAYNTPISRAKTYGNVNFSAIIEESYSQMKTMASTVKKKTMNNINYVKIKTNVNEYYEGEVDENFARSGYGVYYYPNGDIYEGEFQNGQRNGLGEYKYGDNCVYRGEWSKDKRNGRGMIKIGNKQYEGIWENDRFVSGIKYQVNLFERAEIYDSIDNSGKKYFTSTDVGQIKQTNHKNFGNNFDECYDNETQTSISKFNFKISETDSNDIIFREIKNNWKMINFNDYLINIELDTLQIKDNKIKSIESSDSNNSYLNKLFSAHKNNPKDQEKLSFCYFENLKKFFGSNCQKKHSDYKNFQSHHKHDSLDNLEDFKDKSLDDNLTCHCEKFISEIL